MKAISTNKLPFPKSDTGSMRYRPYYFIFPEHLAQQQRRRARPVARARGAQRSQLGLGQLHFTPLHSRNNSTRARARRTLSLFWEILCKLRAPFSWGGEGADKKLTGPLVVRPRTRNLRDLPHDFSAASSNSPRQHLVSSSYFRVTNMSCHVSDIERQGHPLLFSVSVSLSTLLYLCLTSFLSFPNHNWM